MRPSLAAAVLSVLFAFCGFGVLRLAGVRVPGVRGLMATLGLAYLAGLAAVLLVGVALLCAGVAITLPVFFAVGVVIGGAGIALSVPKRGGGWAPAGEWRAVDAWARAGKGRAVAGLAPVAEWRAAAGWAKRRPLAAAATAIGILVALGIAVLGYRWARVMPMSGWDAWAIWGRKGTLLFDDGTLPSAFFTSPAYASMHPDYPMLVPLLESVWFRLVGAGDTQSLHVEFWLLYVAALWTVGYLAARVARPLVWVPLLGLLAFIPAATDQLMTMYADVPMSLFLMAGVLLLGMWIAEPRRQRLILAVLFLAAAANTKNEGLTDAVCALVAALLVTAVRPAGGRRRPEALQTLRGRRALQAPRGLRTLRATGALLPAAGGFVVAVLPWRLWLAAHHVTGDMPIGKGLDPSYLASRSGRIGPTLSALYTHLADQGQWSYLFPLALAVLAACLVARRVSLTRLATFYLLTGIGVFLVLIWAYVINPNGITWYLATSASRTVDGLMFVAAAALLHLTGALTAPAPATVPAPVAEPLPPRGTSPSADEPVPPAPTPA